MPDDLNAVSDDVSVDEVTAMMRAYPGAIPLARALVLAERRERALREALKAMPAECDAQCDCFCGDCVPEPGHIDATERK